MIFYWQTSRAATCLEKIIPVDFSGTIQCDGYQGYDAFQRSRPAGEIILAGCWAHVRRKFLEAIEHATKEATLVLHLLQSLYRTEEKLHNPAQGRSYAQS